MRRLLAFVLVAATGCITTASMKTGADDRSNAVAWHALAEAGNPKPGTIAVTRGRIEAVTVNVVRIVPAQAGVPPLELELGRQTLVTSHGERISRSQLAPGDEVRVSYPQVAASLPPAVHIELVTRPPN